MRVLLLILAVVIAGCADGPAAPEEEAFSLDDKLTATEDTGIIRGVVVDPTVTPIAGAEITVVGGESTVSDAEGAFGFSGLAPGVYNLAVTKPGFASVNTQTSVVAGDDTPPVVRILLEADPTNAPSVLPLSFRGHMGCSLSYIALCGLPVVSDVTEDDFLAEFAVDKPPQWINMEAFWEGTQPTGNSMNLNMGATPAGPDTTFATAQGPSPLLATANETTIAESGVGAGNDLVGRMFAWEMEGTGIDDHTGQCIPVVLTTYCQGPGMALQQDFELIVHLFYNWVPEEGYRFSEHGQPVPPS